jgi:excisionase family DNA binding protein
MHQKKKTTMWLTVKDVCSIYKLKSSTVYLWANSGFIPCYKIGSILRFRKEELDEWVKTYKIPQGRAKKLSRIW